MTIDHLAGASHRKRFFHALRLRIHSGLLREKAVSGLHSILTSRVVRYGLLALTPFLLCIEGWLQWSSHASLAKPLKVKRASDPARLSMQQLYDSLVAGRTDLVQARLVQLQGELPDDIEDWNYGNVQHQFMILSGLLGALQRQRCRTCQRLSGTRRSNQRLTTVE